LAEQEFIKKLDEPQKADLVIAHWTVFSPLASGMYETTKEIVQYENRMDGVIAGIVDPDDQQGGKKDLSTVPQIITQSHDWAYRDANIHFIHATMTGLTHRIKPLVFCIHGSPEACLWSELEPFDKGFSMTSGFQFIEKAEAVIVFMKRHKWMWDKFSEKIRFIQKGVDLERFTPKGMKMRFSGKPNILYGDVWRTIKDPFLTFLALDEYWKMNNNVKFYPWALGDKARMWELCAAKGNWLKFLGEYLMSGAQAYPEQWYRGGDMLISPVITGEPSRVTLEALACGCPVVTWDCDSFGDTQSFKKARPFDPRDMASKIAELWEEIQADPKGIKERARRIAEENYSIKRTAEEVVRIAREVLRKESH